MSLVACTNYMDPPGAKGDKGESGIDGNRGSDGPSGNNGADGRSGTNCNVTTLAPSDGVPFGGSLITCEDSSSIVFNGSTSLQTVVGEIDPCGPSGGHDEVFLRLGNGDLIALFVDNGSALTARLSFLKDGVNYQTTDSQHCNFILTTTGNQRSIISTSPVAITETWIKN